VPTVIVTKGIDPSKDLTTISTWLTNGLHHIHVLQATAMSQVKATKNHQ